MTCYKNNITKDEYVDCNPVESCYLITIYIQTVSFLNRIKLKYSLNWFLKLNSFYEENLQLSANVQKQERFFSDTLLSHNLLINWQFHIEKKQGLVLIILYDNGVCQDFWHEPISTSNNCHSFVAWREILLKLSKLTSIIKC